MAQGALWQISLERSVEKRREGARLGTGTGHAPCRRHSEDLTVAATGTEEDTRAKTEPAAQQEELGNPAQRPVKRCQ